MADNKLSQTYLTLIGNAITDFDNIFTALQAKKAVYNNKQLGQEGARIDNGEVPTSVYKDIIGQLYRIEGGLAPTLVEGVIADKSRGTQALSTSSLSYTEGNAVVSGKIPAAGYYSTDSVLTATIPGYTALVSGTPADGTGYTVAAQADKYVITPEADGVLNSVEIDKGTVTVNLTEANVNGTIGAKSELSALSGTITNATLLPQTSTRDTQGAYTIEFDVTSLYSGTITATSGTSLTKAGYVTALTNTSTSATKTIAETAGEVAKHIITLPKATITGLTGSGTASLEIDSNIATFSKEAVDADTTDQVYYEVKAGGTVSVNAGSATITDGYIKQDDGIQVSNTGSKVTEQSLYIKKGSVGNAEANKATVNITLPSLTKKEGEDGAYTYSTSATVNQEYSKAITAGYVADTRFAANLSGSADLNVNPASVRVTATTSATGSGDTAVFNTTSGAYAYTFNANTTIGNQYTAGYLGSADELSIPTSSTASKTVYVAAGSVTPTVSLSATATPGTNNDGIDQSEENGAKVNIFLDSLTDTQKLRDYYVIEATPAATVNPGYVTGNVTGTAAKKYLPKAKLEYVTASDGASTFIQVTDGGYLPSGLIADITDISGTIDYAEVHVGLTDNFASTVAGAYTITADKAASTNAGYIGGAEGQGSVQGSITVAHGSGVLGCSGNDLTLSATPTPSTDADGAKKYTFHADGSHTTTFTLTQGYTKISDITASSGTLNVSGNVASIVNELDADLVLSMAAVSVPSTSKITLGNGAGTTVAVSESATSYYVVPAVSNGSISAAVTTAGYLSTDDSLALSVQSSGSEAERIYIISGSKLEAVANTATDSTSNLRFVKDNGTYKVTGASYTIPVSGTLTEGYYAGQNLAVSGQATVSAKELAIPAAELSVSEASGYATLSSAAVTLHTKTEVDEIRGEDASRTFAMLSATGVASVVASVDTEGYIEATSQIDVGEITITSNEKYVEIFENAVEGTGENTVNTITIGGQDAQLNNELEQTVMTAEKYVNKNTIVRLHDDAMGANVEAKLKELELRLAGF